MPLSSSGIRRLRRRPLVAAASILTAGLLAAACSSGAQAADDGSGGSGRSGGSADTITLYSGQHEQTAAKLAGAFTEQTGITVKIRHDGEDVLTAQIEQEGSRSPADVFYTENSPWLAQLDQKGLLAKLDPATLAQVPHKYEATTGDWTGVSARVSVLVYNTDKLTPAQLPTSVMGLADPKWKGKLELAPSETDFWPVVSSIAAAKGKPAALAWLKAVKANAGKNDHAPDDETIVSDVAKGVAEVGLINHYYYYRYVAEVGKSKVHAALGYFAAGDPGYVLDVSGAGVLKSSKHQAAAQKFVAFLTSKQGQTVLAHSDSFEYPIGSGVAADPQLKPFDSLHPSSFSLAQLGAGTDAKTLLQQAQLI